MNNENRIREAVISVNADSENAKKTSAENFTSPCVVKGLSGAAKYAIWYAQQELSVFPVKEGGKAPLIPDGFKGASHDLQVVTTWWKQWPNARIGLPTGRANGFFVLDIDKKAGQPSGFDTLQALEAEYGTLPQTVIVRTQSGGEHRYFRASGEFPKNSAGKLGPGLDIRGEGGYVVAAGSKGYRLRDSRIEFGNFAEAPEWLLRKCNSSSPCRSTSSVFGMSLADCVENIKNAKEGERHSTILDSAHSAGLLIFCKKCSKTDAISALKEAINTLRYTQDEREKEYNTVRDGIDYMLNNKDGALTDMQCVAALISEYGAGNLKFCKDRFLSWSGNGPWETVPRQMIKKKILKLLRGKATAQKVKSVEELAAMDLEVEDNVTNYEDEDLCCANGVVSWNEDRWNFTSDFRRDSFNIIKVDVEYSENAICPQFDRYLESTFGSAEDGLQAQRAFCEMMGYTLFRTCALQKCAFLYGRPASGKSVAMHVLQALVGKNNSVELPLCDLKSDKNKAALFLKLLHTVSDLTPKTKFDEGAFNALIAGDTLLARNLYEKPFNFGPTSTTWIATNSLPWVNNFRALERRVVLIPFLRSIPPEEQDSELVQKLKGELPGILNKALSAFAEVKKRGNRFTVVSSTEELFRDWDDSSDSVGAFVRERCDVDPEGKLPFAEIYSAYSLWAKNANIRVPVPQNAFTQKLKEAVPVKSSHSGNTRMIIGLSLKRDWACGR